MREQITLTLLSAMLAAGHKTFWHGGGEWDIATLINGERKMPDFLLHTNECTVKSLRNSSTAIFVALAAL